MTRTFPTPSDISPNKPVQDIINSVEAKIKSCEFTFKAPWQWGNYANTIKNFLEQHRWYLEVDTADNTWTIKPMI